MSNNNSDMFRRFVILIVIVAVVAIVAGFMLMDGKKNDPFPSSSSDGTSTTTTPPSPSSDGTSTTTTPPPEWQSGPRVRCLEDNTAITGIKLDKQRAAQFEWTCGDIDLDDTYTDQRMASNKVEYEDGTVKDTLTCGQGRVLRSVAYNLMGDNFEYTCHKRADADDIAADESRQKSRLLFRDERNACSPGEVMQGIRTDDYICSK